MVSDILEQLGSIGGIKEKVSERRDRGDGWGTIELTSREHLLVVAAWTKQISNLFILMLQ